MYKFETNRDALVSHLVFCYASLNYFLPTMLPLDN